MNQRSLKILGFASLALGVVLYLIGVSGVFWPSTPPGDVGLVATCGVFVLFGVLQIALSKVVSAPANA